METVRSGVCRPGDSIYSLGQKTARLILREKTFRDTNMTRTDKAGLQQWTVDSCFPLVGARQHCVAKICNTSQRPTHRNLI